MRLWRRVAIVGGTLTTMAWLLWLNTDARNEFKSEQPIRYTGPQGHTEGVGLSQTTASAVVTPAAHRKPLAPPAAAASTQSSTTASTVTLENAVLTPNERRKLLRAEEVIVQSCMHERGFPYKRQSYSDADVEDHQFEAVDPTDEDAARAVGYNITLGLERGGREPGADANAAFMNSLSSEERNAYDEALGGSQDVMRLSTEELELDPNFAFLRGSDGSAIMWDRRSCIAQAQDRVAVDLERVEGLDLELDVLRALVESVVAADDGVSGALELWRACMADEGFFVESPASARRGLRKSHEQEGWSLEELWSRERPIAQQDARCQRRSQLSAMKKLARERAWKEMATQHQEIFAELQTLNRGSLARAEMLLDADEELSLSESTN